MRPSMIANTLRSNMMGELGASRLAMGHVPERPMALNGKLTNPSLLRQSASLKHLLRPDAHTEPLHSRFGHSKVRRRPFFRRRCARSMLMCDLLLSCMQTLGPSNLGGNPGRISSYDAALLANAPPIGLMHATLTGKPRPSRTRNPITGDVPKAAPAVARSLRGSESSMFGGSKPMLFPARGTINSIGSFGSLGSLGSSPSGRSTPTTRKLEYELWCEAQKRAAAERELKQVIIHGRSRPPWVGDASASGYEELRGRGGLMPQSR